MRIYKIALTGGPCAGKTDVFNFISNRLKELKYNVITIPETARELIENGIPPHGDKQHTIEFQDTILNRQIQKEKDAKNFSKGKQTTIILCDRGIMDGQAYMDDKNDFTALLNNYNLQELNAVDQYDLVIDLVSLASYAPELYVLDDVRDEDLETAKSKDYKATMAWLLHSNIKMILPTKTITEKQNIVLNHILNTIQPTVEIKNENKTYEIDLDDSDFSNYTVENSKIINIIDNYLDTGICDVKYILSDREYDNAHSYTLKMCRGEDNNLKYYYQKTITKEEFDQYFNWNIPYKVINRKELKFIDNLQIYKINFYEDKAILEIETTNHINQDYIPSNIKIKEKKEKTLAKNLKM